MLIYAVRKGEGVGVSFFMAAPLVHVIEGPTTTKKRKKRNTTGELHLPLDSICHSLSCMLPHLRSEIHKTKCHCKVGC